MIGSTRNVRVWAWPQPVDMRKGYDGLYGLVANVLGQDPLSGDCFLFTNANRRRAKVLFWDGTGLCIFQKRLEVGRFAKLWSAEAGATRLTTSELALYLEGSAVTKLLPLSPPDITPKSLAETRGL